MDSSLRVASVRVPKVTSDSDPQVYLIRDLLMGTVRESLDLGILLRDVAASLVESPLARWEVTTPQAEAMRLSVGAPVAKVKAVTATFAMSSDDVELKFHVPVGATLEQMREEAWQRLHAADEKVRSEYSLRRYNRNDRMKGLKVAETVERL